MSTVGRGALSEFANIATGTTDGAIVTAVAGRKIRVIAFAISCGATVPQTIVFNTKPAGAGSAISATFNQQANGTVQFPQNTHGHFTTNVGEGLTATTSGAGSTTGIQVTYQVI